MRDDPSMPLGPPLQKESGIAHSKLPVRSAAILVEIPPATPRENQCGAFRPLRSDHTPVPKPGHATADATVDSRPSLPAQRSLAPATRSSNREHAGPTGKAHESSDA